MQEGSYRRRFARGARDHVGMPPGCWPSQDEVDEDAAELRALAQGTGEHLPTSCACSRRSRPWPPQAA